MSAVYGVLKTLKRKGGKTRAELDVAFQTLKAMEEEGLIEETGTRHTGGRGRPSKEYSIVKGVDPEDYKNGSAPARKAKKPAAKGKPGRKPGKTASKPAAKAKPAAKTGNVAKKTAKGGAIKIRIGGR
jgi:hypothetical protein